jgi:NAD(P) transhydrogenase
VRFDERTVLDSDGILNLPAIPDALVVVGAGVIGIEYASMFAALGTKVNVVEQREHLLEFCDRQVVEALQYHLRDLGVTFRFGDAVVAVEPHDGGTITHLNSGKRIASNAVMYSAGRQGATDKLGLDAAGIEADARGLIAVDDHYRTSAKHIYAVGDVIGFPSLAATAMEQGRLAAAHACGIEPGHISKLLPIGIYTIPEISFVGKTEETLTDEQIAYEVGISRYRELARGAILGDAHGILKLLVSVDDRRLLGVHVFGTNATELVHIGQTLMAFNGTVDHLVETVFNYPTLAESYKVAALDATNKLRTISTVSASAALGI